ncbi:hypothetical protein [Bacillus salipaludis]|uniref:Transporter n=1 Tax=Bacillus salipaludis TaxID=2547811 RepID=A0AA90R5N3_9BACI|nr:hypothetical protein [Bacillus salipaludis]MDQ6598061.1 hypothetical protein [Bacillus salipaludis]
MYPNHIHLYYNIPNSQDAYLSATPIQADYYSTLDPRQFGGFQPPTAPPPGHHAPGAGPSPGHPAPEEGPPTSPPPSVVPQQTHQAGAFAVDPGSMVRCLHRYTYVWLRGFEQFWFYPTFIGRHSVSGYRWTGRRWVNFGISLRQIQSFTCV